MPSYHVRVTRKSRRTHDAVELDLNERQLVKRITTPFQQGEVFMCGGEPIDLFDVERIRINETELPSGNLLPKIRAKRARSTIKAAISDEWFVTKEGEDVTNVYITTPPKKGKKISRKSPVHNNKVFIVHGRDDKQALLLQKYLKDKLKVDALMFDDLPDKGRTIIEQLEFIRDNVGYAFVIVTPDDVGCLTEDIEQAGMLVAGLETVTAETVGKIFELFHTRARQNVVFELGLFIGALGRERVCCLLNQDTEERPSDLDGILYKPFNRLVSEMFHEIPEELEGAGYEQKM